MTIRHVSSITSAEGERLVGVLRHNQGRGAIPTWFVSRKQAQDLLNENSAGWFGRWTLRLYKPKPLKLHDVLAVHPGVSALSGSMRSVYLQDIHGARA